MTEDRENGIEIKEERKLVVFVKNLFFNLYSFKKDILLISELAIHHFTSFVSLISRQMVTSSFISVKWTTVRHTSTDAILITVFTRLEFEPAAFVT